MTANWAAPAACPQSGRNAQIGFPVLRADHPNRHIGRGAIHGLRIMMAKMAVRGESFEK